MADDVYARAIDAMSDVQRRSLQAAGALVERLVAAVDGSREPGEQRDDRDDPNESPADDAIAGLAKLWRASITSLAAMVPSLTGNGSAHVDATAARSPGSSLRVELDPGTSTGTVEAWVHNPGHEPFDKLRPHCGTPRAHDGSALDALSVMIEPDTFDLPPRSSRGVEITVRADGARPGCYRTLLLIDGLPDCWLPFEIAVPEPAP